MKRTMSLGLILLIVTSFSFVAYAADDSSKGTASLQDSRKQIGQKAERGVGNVAFGWTEIPKRVVDITKETNNPFWGLVAGVYQGTLKAMARTASGAMDVATCGVKSTDKPFINPELDVANIK